MRTSFQRYWGGAFAKDPGAGFDCSIRSSGEPNKKLKGWREFWVVGAWPEPDHLSDQETARLKVQSAHANLNSIYTTGVD